MNDRDELAHEIRGLLHAEGAYCGNCDYESASCYECDNVLHRYADAILDSGYRKPRTITAVEELHELPDEAVIRDRFRDVWELTDEKGSSWREGYRPGQEMGFSVTASHLPATVLYVPEEQS